MSEYIDINHEPGMSGAPDEKSWQRWKRYLSPDERRIYLYLRWLSTSPSFNGRAMLRHLARDIGDEIDGWKWESKGSMSQARFLRGVERLHDLGLVEMQGFGDDW